MSKVTKDTPLPGWIVNPTTGEIQHEARISPTCTYMHLGLVGLHLASYNRTLAMPDHALGCYSWN